MMNEAMKLDRCIRLKVGRVMMRLFCVRSFAMALFVVGILLASLAAKAQDPSTVAPGINPQGTYHSGDFDSVDLTTGRLHLHIPLVEDASQRGKLNFTYSLEYTSPGTWNQPLYPARGPWTPSRYGLGGVALANLSMPTGGFTIHYLDHGPPAENYYEHTICQGGCGAGQTHDVPGTGGSVIDGSGFLLNNGLQFSGSSACLNYGLITDTNGNQMSESYTTNGNSVTCTTTDTLGRTWTYTTGTTTNLSACPVTAVSTTVWNVPGPANGVRQFIFCYSNVTILTSLPVAGNGIQYSLNTTLMTGVVLPDGTKWYFRYDGYGDITYIGLPTGGTISYTWATIYDNCAAWMGYVQTVASRITYDGTNLNTWNYSFMNGTGGQPANYAPYVMTDPLGNDTVTTGMNCGGVALKVQNYSGTGANRTLIKTVTNTYQSLPDPFPSDVNSPWSPGPQLLLSSTTQWPNGQTSEVTKTYDCGYFSFTDTNPYGGTYTSTCPSSGYNTTYGLQTSETNNDYGNQAPGPALSTTNTTYISLANSSYLSAKLLGLVQSKVVTNGSGNYCQKPTTVTMSRRRTHQIYLSSACRRHIRFAAISLRSSASFSRIRVRLRRRQKQL